MNVSEFNVKITILKEWEYFNFDFVALSNNYMIYNKTKSKWRFPLDSTNFKEASKIALSNKISVRITGSFSVERVRQANCGANQINKNNKKTEEKQPRQNCCFSMVHQKYFHIESIRIRTWILFTNQRNNIAIKRVY